MLQLKPGQKKIEASIFTVKMLGAMELRVRVQGPAGELLSSPGFQEPLEKYSRIPED